MDIATTVATAGATTAGALTLTAASPSDVVPAKSMPIKAMSAATAGAPTLTAAPSREMTDGVSVDAHVSPPSGIRAGKSLVCSTAHAWPDADYGGY